MTAQYVPLLTFLHLSPGTSALVTVTAIPTRHSQFANKKESIDYYMNSEPHNPLTTKDNCDRVSHNRN